MSSTESPDAKKTCSHCGKEKRVVDFEKDKTRKDGRRGVCKVCRAAQKGRTARGGSREADKLAQLHRDALLILARRHPDELKMLVNLLARERKIIGRRDVGWRSINL